MNAFYVAALALILFQVAVKKEESTPTPAGNIPDYKRAFVTALWLAADEVSREVGWPRDLIISVAAHESNWGRSGLTKLANNLFGFKVNTEWLAAGKPYVEMPTGEVFGGVATTIKAKFRAYPTWADSVRDYVRLITTLSRYAKANEYAKRGDLQGYFKAVKEGGYATDPRYDEKLSGMLAQIKSLA